MTDSVERMTTGSGAPAPAKAEEAVLRAHGFHRLTVKRIVDETSDTRSFVLDVPPELQDSFRYRSGQFCTFRVRTDGDEHLRSYSMSSAPDTDPELTVTVKRVPGGLVSNWFLDRVAVGEVLEVTRPAGVFCLGVTEAPVVAFCGGSGVTPVISIVKTALATTHRPVRILYANRSRESVIFDANLADLQTRYPDRFDIRRHFDTDSGYVDAIAIRAFIGGADNGDFYVCGPEPFMDLVESTLLTIGVTPERIFIERFNIGSEPAVVAGERPPAAVIASSGEEVAESVTIIMKGKKTTVPYQRADTVLETARRGGLNPPFSCEAGDCATCMAILREGSAKMRVNNALTPEEVDEGWILTCQSLPKGRSITVEYESF